jgi:Icc-related predicted phosphoesterase
MRLNFENDKENNIFYNVVTVGDIHGEFEKLVNCINSQYKFKDTIIIVCGDCGFGFYKPNYYKLLIARLNRKLEENNNHIIFLRGNHDDPQYFDDKTVLYTNIKAVSDYSVITTWDHTCLLVGGAISVDRKDRIKAMETEGYYSKKDFEERSLYWENENFVFDQEKLDTIHKEYSKQITHVFTHSNPNFCYPFSHNGLREFIEKDELLLQDVMKERGDISNLFYNLVENKQPIRSWYNGHYHASYTEFIEDCRFTVLDIMKFEEVY